MRGRPGAALETLRGAINSLPGGAFNSGAVGNELRAEYSALLAELGYDHWADNWAEKLARYQPKTTPPL